MRVAAFLETMSRALGALLGLAVLALVLPVAIVGGLDLFLNTTLRLALNLQPERMRITYDVAWLSMGGTVSVHNLAIRQQSPQDQWLLNVDRASVRFDLADLWAHTIHLAEADGTGARFRWRPRIATAPSDPANDLSPPIDGLQNPPDPDPEEIYPLLLAWKVLIDDARISNIHEIWIDGYRFAGDAYASGSLVLQANEWVEVEGATLQIDDGGVTRGGESILRSLRGEMSVDIVGTPLNSGSGRDLFGAASGRARLQGEVADLAFLDFYLRSAPWLSLSGGVGTLDVDLTLEDGRVREGSRVAADVRDTVAHFRSYSIIGDATVKLGVVGSPELGPHTEISLDFLDFTVLHDGDQAPHATGRGFRVSASTPDTALDRPFTGIEATFDLPSATIPDVRVYNSYLPREGGLTLRSGTGTIRGNLHVSTEGSRCHGELHLTAEGVKATLDELDLGGSVELHAVVPEGDLQRGEYDVSGTTLSLKDIRVASDVAKRGGRDGSKGWWAKVSVPTGKVAVGAPEFMNGQVDLTARDTVPFVTIFSARQPLPGWIRGLLGVKNVTARARVRLGDEVQRVSDFEMTAGGFELRLEFRRRHDTAGKLFARFGGLALGVAVSDTKNEVQVFGARKWYDAAPSPP